MKLKAQTVSLGLAMVLKALSVPQYSTFAWYQYEGYDPYIEYKEMEQRKHGGRMAIDGYSEDPTLICSAPTVAELGEMLPAYFASYRTEYDGWQCESPWGFNDLYVIDSQKYQVYEKVLLGIPQRLVQEAQTEANARAKMVIFLIKEGIIKAEEIGK